MLAMDGRACVDSSSNGKGSRPETERVQLINRVTAPHRAGYPLRK